MKNDSTYKLKQICNKCKLKMLKWDRNWHAREELREEMIVLKEDFLVIANAMPAKKFKKFLRLYPNLQQHSKPEDFINAFFISNKRNYLASLV